ncbi:MAG TPA: polysaccharide deacetylase family protein [Terracidiphilus sp.]|nr:polysaccharide deacetylase family protein [Terracidiphilus sp.]
MYLSPAHFRQRLEALRAARIEVLPLEEGLSRLRAGSLPPRAAVITFDDGYYDFYGVAMPLLREFGFPATLYLSTYYCDHRLPVFNLMIPYLLWKSGRTTVNWGEAKLPPMPVGTRSERFLVTQTLLRLAESRQLDTRGKDDLARHLAAHLGIDYDDLLQARLFQLVTPEEAALTSRAGIDIQLHTHRHRTPRDQALFTREIRDNRNRIREFTGLEATHFCYPSGDYAQEFLPWLRELGVKSATTCEAGLASQRSEPLLLPRLLDDDLVTPVEFESWLCGIRL